VGLLKKPELEVEDELLEMAAPEEDELEDEVLWGIVEWSS
jgi:hypothetical protein